MDDRLKKQMEFMLEVDKSKFVRRQTYLSDGIRRENDAEHSWHLALMAALLSEHANEKIDIARTMLMVLIHDIVEIDAGDTYAYDDAGHLDKREREVKAAKRIFGLLPEDQAEKMMDLWEEFEASETPEAKFAHSLDCVQPLMLNDATDGKSWREHEIKRSQVMKRNAGTAQGSALLMEYVNAVLKNNSALLFPLLALPIPTS